MKKINKILISLAFSLSACFGLEEDTGSILTISQLRTEADFDAALAPIFAIMATANRDPHKRITTAGADDITTWNGGNKAPIRLYDGFGYGGGEGADAAWLAIFSWDSYWEVIYASNAVIDGVENSEGDPKITDHAKAVASFTRAISYFNLVRIFGGVPLVLDVEEVDETIGRATVWEVYKVIESDLKFAADNLPEPGSVASLGHPSNAAAKSWLASLYLTWGGWPVKDDSKYTLAAGTAKEVIDMGYFELLSIDELWALENANSKESVFSLQYSAGENKTQLLPRGFSPHVSGGFSDFFAERDFYNRFPDGARKEATFAEMIPIRERGSLELIEEVHWTDSMKTGRFNPVYKKFTESGDPTVEFKLVSYRAIELFRYAEVLLIFAEAQARVNGGTPESIEALNQVKRRAAGLPYNVPDLGGVDVPSATPDEIVEESGWELAGEFRRWFDLVRTEKVEQIAALRDPSEKVVMVGTPGKQHYIAPLPLKSVTGTNLLQNPEGFIIK